MSHSLLEINIINMISEFDRVIEKRKNTFGQNPIDF